MLLHIHKLFLPHTAAAKTKFSPKLSSFEIQFVGRANTFAIHTVDKMIYLLSFYCARAGE